MQTKNAASHSQNPITLTPGRRLIAAALVVLVLITATACRYIAYWAGILNTEDEIEFSFAWNGKSTGGGWVSPVDPSIPVSVPSSDDMATVEIRTGEVAVARLYANNNKGMSVKISAPDDFYVMPPKEASESTETFDYETKRLVSSSPYYREGFYYIMALTPGAEAKVTGSADGLLRSKALRIKCTSDDLFAPQTYQFDGEPHAFEIEGYGDVSFELIYKRSGAEVSAGDVIGTGTYDVEIGIKNAHFPQLALSKTSQLIIESTDPAEQEDNSGKSGDATLNHFYVTFPDTSAVHLNDPAARQSVRVYEMTSAVVTAIPCDPKATVSGAVGAITLGYGMNTFNVVVTAEDGTVVNYPYVIYVDKHNINPPVAEPTPLPSSDATLKSLTVTKDYGTSSLVDIPLAPSPFDPTVTNYWIEGSQLGGSNVNFTGVANDDGATVTGNATYSSDPASVTITVTAEDGVTKKNYVITVNPA